MKDTVFTIDGRQLCGQMGGVQRYISEMVFELDKIASPEMFEVLIPSSCNIDLGLKNLKVVKYGKLNNRIWEQIDLPFYIWKNKRIGIYFCSVVPILYPRGIAVVHDIMGALFPELIKSMGFFTGKIFLLNLRSAVKHSDYPATSSENTKRDMIKVYGRKEEDISVFPCAWQHIQRVECDDCWMERYPNVKEKEYYFSLAANRKQKNFQWIEMMAHKHPDSLFLMAGTIEEWQKNDQVKAQNIIQLGYISDGEIKSLMTHCKAFLFPSFYEGFGMPPMEALACGAKIIISNTSCLPEIYQDSAYYISPNDYDVDLDELLSIEVASPKKCLDRFSWEKSAKMLYEKCSIISQNR